ncbi:MAG: glycosyltransferase family 4 protein [Candidatus Nanoarchaeia archaeon]|nr:glycosyltransferase family 4 protein [Candidatus Nanoarchaeia archaeon]
MRICHINMFYYPTIGGVEQVMREFAERQVKEGHEVHVFCCDSDKYKRIEKKEEILNGVHIHRLRYWFKLSIFTYIWPNLLPRLLKEKKFDIYHSHVSGHLYILLTGIASRIKKGKHIHTTHCPWTDASFRPKILKIPLWINDKFLNKLSFKLIDKVISITPWEVDTFLKKYSKEEKIKVIPNGMDKILFKKVIPNNFKKNNNIKDKLVLFFGRLNPTKGPEVLAKAAIEITKERKDIDFLWVGPDEGKAKEVEDLIKDYKNMKYLGPIRGKDKIAEMLQAADVYVLPSYREGLPLTLFEAMAAGLPIVACPVNGVPYEMKDPDNGYFINYGDINALKEKILKILDNPEIAKKMSKNNIEKSKSYDWDIIYKKYMEEYQKLVKI